MFTRQLFPWIFVLLLSFCAVGVRAVTLEQVISHENPNFNNRNARLTVGKDGMVYVANGGNPSGYVLRLTREGTLKTGGDIPYCTTFVAANAQGTLAVAAAHFTHSILYYDPSFKQFATFSDIRYGDDAGWDAPRFVEVGASGDFYALDQYRSRVQRLTSTGTVVAIYPIRAAAEADWGSPDEFRVCEKNKTIYYLSRGEIHCSTLDGKTQWMYKTTIGGNGWDGYHGGFDVDENGTLYVMAQDSKAITVINSDGKPGKSIPLQMGNYQPGPGMGITSLRIFGGDVILKRYHPAELFQCYDLATGALKRVVNMDCEKLTVIYPREVWTAGEILPFRIDFSKGDKIITPPRWHAWLCPLGTSDYREATVLPPKELGLSQRLQVPDDAAGLYQLKVTPETQPVQSGLVSEYLVHAVVEIRKPQTQGTVSVQTPNNRIYYGRGETIPVRLLFGDKGDPNTSTSLLPASVTVDLLDGKRVVAQRTLPVNGERQCKFSLDAAFTKTLRPGKYTFNIDTPGFSCAAQSLTIGPGVEDSPFKRVMYGDYGATYPDGDFWTASDTAASHLARMQKLGFNLMVDRLGISQEGEAISGTNQFNATIRDLGDRLKKNPEGVALEKATISPAFLQAMAGYAADGQQQMAILMYNDAGLPMGTGFDGRKPEEFAKDIARVTDSLKSYASFRGWSWASNWWVGKVGADAATSKEQGEVYKAAFKLANDTGKWDPVLEQVSDNWLGYAVDAEKFYNGELRKLAPNLVTATAAPYRNVYAYPPTTFKNVDEVDLQIQWEQMAPPYHAPHNVDFYTRPGKRAWGHPEIWNDDGTGGQILPTLFQMVMRGAGGVGQSGPVPVWGQQPEDSRLAYSGMASIYRSLNTVLADYGPWLTTLKSNDHVAIIASGRMFRLDDWPNVWGRHFARVCEAYVGCLHAHYPASIIFTDDLTPETLKPYKAILVIDQRLEMELAMAEALRAAKAAGKAVFADASCRPELVKDCIPLGISFDHFEKDPSAAGDDAAYWRFLANVRLGVPALSKALRAIMPPAAEIDNDEVFLSERAAGDARYLFVVNNTTPQLEPAQMWRATLCVTSRVPLVQPVKLPADAKVVYDVFAGKQVKPQQGMVQADLRTLPARVYAILPVPIADIVLRGPKSVKAGQPFNWSVSVCDAAGKPIRASIPIRVRFLAADGSVLENHPTAVLTDASTGSFVMPLNPPPGTAMLEATELISLKSARLPVKSTPQLAVAALEANALPSAAPATTAALGIGADKSQEPAEALFGPHIRDIVVSADGTQVVMNAMNWDNNLYAVDTASGKVRWQQRLGHYFTFAPQALANGVAVQGFDFNAAESYHLYLVDPNGKAERRFALYGLSRRMPHRFVPGLLNDHMNNFAVPANGEWVATAGDLGLAVWSRDGKLRWSQDWWKDNRYTPQLTGTENWGTAKLVTPMVAALDAQTLLVCHGPVVSAYDAEGGKQRWQLNLAASGDVRKVLCTPDGGTCALLTTTEGGRVFILRNGAVLQMIPTAADDGALTTDGAMLAVTTGNLVKCYTLGQGLQWSFAGDDQLHFPRLDATNQRLVVSSNLGSVYVLNRRGSLLLQRDMGALSAPAWLPDGDLVLASWMGKVTRMNLANGARWSTHLQPELIDMRGKIIADDGVPTTRIASWSNADPNPAPLTPNLLAETKATVKFIEKDHEIGFTQSTAQLVDGKIDAPAKPWLNWNDISWLGEGSAFNYLLLDTFRTQLKVTGITLVEDPAHPESWLHDAYVEYWDAAKEQWVFVQPLLSNAPIHTHTFAKPVESARFRIVLPPGLVGNLRLGEIVLHGEVLGASHPDAAAKKPVAVLFDEQMEDLKCMQYGDNGFSFKFDGAYSGTRCLQIAADKGAMPAYRPETEHTVPNWDFQIAEHPQPGQYRYLQFAWKALSPATKGITLRVAPSHFGGIALVAGTPTNFEGMAIKKVADVPPTEWTIVRVDLWEALQQHPLAIRNLSLGAVGGAAVFDRILLGRTEEDLKNAK